MIGTFRVSPSRRVLSSHMAQWVLFADHWLAPRFTEQGLRVPHSRFCFTPTHDHISVISVSTWTTIRCQRLNSFSASPPATFTSALLPIHFLPSPTLVSNPLELFHFWNLKTSWFFSKFNPSSPSHSQDSCLSLTLLPSPTLDSLRWTQGSVRPSLTQFFHIPCWTHPESKSWINSTISSAPTGRLQSTAGKMTQLLGLTAVTFPKSLNSPDHENLSKNPFTLPESVPSSISQTGCLRLCRSPEALVPVSFPFCRWVLWSHHWKPEASRHETSDLNLSFLSLKTQPYLPGPLFRRCVEATHDLTPRSRLPLLLPNSQSSPGS